MLSVLIVIFGLGIFASIGASIICTVLSLIHLIRKNRDEAKRGKKRIIISLISLGACMFAFVTILIVGPKLDPVGWCDHEYHIVEAKDSTCTDSGYVKKVCSLCQNEITETIDAGHAWIDESQIEATCSHGQQIVKRCSVCNATKTVETGSPISHIWIEKSVIEATCSTPKLISRECSVCHAEESVEVGSTTPHSFEDWKIVVEATESTEGQKTRECEMCHYTEYASIDKVSYISVTANELWNAFHENEVAAEQKYNGRTVRITGVVIDINSAETFKSANVLLKVDGYGGAWGCIQCNFNSKNTQALANLNKGEIVTIEGTCGKIEIYNLMIRGCLVVE